MDSGAAFELDTNKASAIMTILGSILLTAFFWAEIFNLFHGGKL
jgi:hypothetical protein